MTVKYDLTLKIWATTIFSKNLDEEVEHWLDDALYYDLDTIVNKIAEVDKEVAEKFDQMVEGSDIDASEIIDACDYKEEEITLKAFQEDKILLNIPVYINIEQLKKVLG